MSRVLYTSADYLDLTPEDARRQWLSILDRRPVDQGKRQENFNPPVETILCLAAMYLVDSSRFSNKAAVNAPRPVPELARLFRRPPTSVIAKMDNLDGGARPKGNKNDVLVAAALRSDPPAPCRGVPGVPRRRTERRHRPGDSPGLPRDRGRRAGLAARAGRARAERPRACRRRGARDVRGRRLRRARDRADYAGLRPRRSAPVRARRPR